MRILSLLLSTGALSSHFSEPNGEVKVSPLPGNLPNKPKEE